MALFTHSSQTLRTTTPGGHSIVGDVTVTITAGATLTRERTLPVDVSTYVYPNATTSYTQPSPDTIVGSGFTNAPVFGTLTISGGNINVPIEGFDVAPQIGVHIVGREHGVVEGYVFIDGFESQQTFGTPTLIWDQFPVIEGFVEAPEFLPAPFVARVDITYDLDGQIDASGDITFGDLYAFHGLVEDRWIEDPTTTPNDWGRNL